MEENNKIPKVTSDIASDKKESEKNKKEVIGRSPLIYANGIPKEIIEERKKLYGNQESGIIANTVAIENEFEEIGSEKSKKEVIGRSPLIYANGIPKEIIEERKKSYGNQESGIIANTVAIENEFEEIGSEKSKKEVIGRSPIIYENGIPDFIVQEDVKYFSINKCNTIPSGIEKTQITMPILPDESVFMNNTSEAECNVNNQPIIYGEAIDKSFQDSENAIKTIIETIHYERDKNSSKVSEQQKQSHEAILNRLVYSGLFINLDYHILYFYDDNYGLFRKVSGNSGIALIKSILSYEILALQGRKLMEDLISDSRISVSEIEFSKGNMYINLFNGVLNLNDMKLYNRSFNRSLYFTVCVGADFYEKFTSYENAIQNLIGTMPYFNQFLNSSLLGSPERIRLLFEIIGYSVSNITPLKKLIILQGANDSGKSLITKFLVRLMTEYSDKTVVATLSLAELGCKFTNQLIEGAKLVCGGELDSNSKAIDMSVVKKITGGDMITVERKFCNPRSIIPNCKLLFSTNEALDLVGETTYAMVKRIHTLKFPISIPESQQDLNLLEHILTERSQIVTIAMWALKELLERGEFTKDPDHIKLEEQYIAQIPEIVIDKFISENLVIGLNYYVTEAELQDKYSIYCYTNDYVCLKVNTFLKKIKTKLNLTFEIINNQKVIKGIAIKGELLYEK